MAELPMLECHVLDTGHCLVSESLLIRGGRRLRVECHSIVGLLCHPTDGWFLWDTGYAPRLRECTRRWPYRLYRWATPLRLRPELAVAAQLNRFGLVPGDIRRVILSHLHADHLAGLRDFPEARVFVTESAYASVTGRTGLDALLRAFVPALLPEDFEQRAVFLQTLRGEVMGAMGPTHDLFGDGSARLVALPGHARGQVGLLARTRQGSLFFVADSCFVRDGYRLQRDPHWLTRLVTDDPEAQRTTLARLHAFALASPEVTLVPSHCPEAFREHVGTAP